MSAASATTNPRTIAQRRSDQRSNADTTGRPASSLASRSVIPSELA